MFGPCLLICFREWKLCLWGGVPQSSPFLLCFVNLCNVCIYSDIHYITRLCSYYWHNRPTMLRKEHLALHHHHYLHTKSNASAEDILLITCKWYMCRIKVLACMEGLHMSKISPLQPYNFLQVITREEAQHSLWMGYMGIPWSAS